MRDTITLKQQPGWGEEVFSLLSWFDIERVKNARIMVVGAGALGNEVIKNLALFGVGTIVIVDYDTIEFSNLSRSVLFRPSDATNNRLKVEAAAQQVREINPEVTVLPIAGDVGPDVGLGLFRQMDLIIGCLDSRQARYLINQHAFRVNKPWVDGAIENLEGYVRIFNQGVSCYSCALTDEEKSMLALRTGCPDVAKMNFKQGRIATTPVSASIIGAIQVQEALKLLHDMDENQDGFKVLKGRLFKYDGMYLGAKIFKMNAFNDDCPVHDIWEPVVEADALSANTTVKDALEILKETLQCGEVSINLVNNVFVESIYPEKTETEYKVMLPESKMAKFLEENSLGINTLAKVFQKYIDTIDKDFPYPHLTLRETGIPELDIIEVETSDGFKYVELSKDRELYSFIKT